MTPRESIAPGEGRWFADGRLVFVRTWKLSGMTIEWMGLFATDELAETFVESCNDW